MNVSVPGLTVDAFRTWLEQHRPGEIVGIRGCGDVCPIAGYLSDHGFRGLSVGDATIAYSAQGEPKGYAVLATPDWAAEFIHLVDSSGTTGSGIRQSTALKALSEVTS